jgi:hypothetical protein
MILEIFVKMEEQKRDTFRFRFQPHRLFLLLLLSLIVTSLSDIIPLFNQTTQGTFLL